MARAPTLLLWQELCGCVLPVERRAPGSEDTPGTTGRCELYKHASLPMAHTTPALPTPGMPSAKRAKEGADLLRQQRGLFPGGEVAASGHLFPAQDLV